MRRRCAALSTSPHSLIPASHFGPLDTALSLTCSCTHPSLIPAVPRAFHRTHRLSVPEHILRGVRPLQPGAHEWRAGRACHHLVTRWTHPAPVSVVVGGQSQRGRSTVGLGYCFFWVVWWACRGGGGVRPGMRAVGMGLSPYGRQTDTSSTGEWGWQSLFGRGHYCHHAWPGTPRGVGGG